MMPFVVSVLRRLIRSTGFDVVRFPARDKYREFEQKLRNDTNSMVISGPFEGCKVMDSISWGNDTISKILGFYEQELHSIIEDAISWKPDIVINVGCAEGYYAIGFAKRLPDARVFAFDVDEKAQKVCELSAQINNVSVRIKGLCNSNELVALSTGSDRPLLLIDCEGGERDLLLETPYNFATARILVECHDCFYPNTTELLIKKYSKTHRINNIFQGPRNPFASQHLRQIGNSDAWNFISERRAAAMNWLYMVPQREKVEIFSNDQK